MENNFKNNTSLKYQKFSHKKHILYNIMIRTKNILIIFQPTLPEVFENQLSRPWMGEPVYESNLITFFPVSLRNETQLFLHLFSVLPPPFALAIMPEPVLYSPHSRSPCAMSLFTITGTV